ncbi:MAG: ribokinase, partial [Candidatus Actinomarina sp.]|nr:ribokinase [Candidatus Actinomarina sp.]
AYEEKNLIEYSKSLSGNLVVTLGEKGAAYVKGDEVLKFPAPKVKAIDTTGAGDAFVGAFSFGISSGLSAEESVKIGIEKATDSVTKSGTQSSYSN